MAKKLHYGNLLGLDESLKNGKIAEGSVNGEILAAKTRFPKEVVLCRVGEFYEAVGIDAVMLVEHAGLNPMSGQRLDYIPRAGCPVVNLRATLDSLTACQLSVCVIEEAQGPTSARQKKTRFVAGHAHPGSPYVYGLAGDDVDIVFAEPMPVVGIARSARGGYTYVAVVEVMRTYTEEEGLTEEAVVAKLRAHPPQRLFLHNSLRGGAYGGARWGEFGEGGLLWGEVHGKDYSWYEDDPTKRLLFTVKEMMGLPADEHFLLVVPPPGERPNPLFITTASQMGVLPSPGVPCLLRSLLPLDAPGLCESYLRDLLLHPPPARVAYSIQAAGRAISELQVAAPTFQCIAASKLVKLIGASEMNSKQFAALRAMAADVISFLKSPQLRPIGERLLDPTWLSTGLHATADNLVADCEEVVRRVDAVLCDEGEGEDEEQEPTGGTGVRALDEFFESMEGHWKGKVQHRLVAAEYARVRRTAAELTAAVQADFLPVEEMARARSAAGHRNVSAEVLFNSQHQTVWLRGKHFKLHAVSSDFPGEAEVKRLVLAQGPGIKKKVGDDWHTTARVESASQAYQEAVEDAASAVVEQLRQLAGQLRGLMNAIVSVSTFSIIARTLFTVVREGQRRGWTFPSIGADAAAKGGGATEGSEAVRLRLEGLVPFWLELNKDAAVPNNVELVRLPEGAGGSTGAFFLLTGPNGGGKSSLLRAIGAAALLGNCGLMVPATAAHMPTLASIVLRMSAGDSPADRKSAFEVEMRELRAIMAETGPRSLVLLDELCRGTEEREGTCLAASVVEHLNAAGCIGVLSTHLHSLLDMELSAPGVVHMCMGTVRSKARHPQSANGRVPGVILRPSWRLEPGECRDSLAFEAAEKEGVPWELIERAKEFKTCWPPQKRGPSSGTGTRSRARSGRQPGSASSEPLPELPQPKRASPAPASAAPQADRSSPSAAAGEPEEGSGLPQRGAAGERGAVGTRAEADPEEVVIGADGGDASGIASGDASRDASGDASARRLAWPSQASSDVLRLFADICGGVLGSPPGTPWESAEAVSDGSEKGMGVGRRRAELEVVVVGERETPPPYSNQRSVVYLARRSDGFYYVGQTDDIDGRVRAHRMKAEMQKAEFAFVMIPSGGMSCARQLETRLIQGLRTVGVPLTNRGDQAHRHFGAGLRQGAPF